ncbi:MAG: hypothetical protein QOH84_3915 [Kribbellaceae bacterium]|jgi:hypothetical protein|nr:hypothetical protein [Kribbellaceae bacterium]
MNSQRPGEDKHKTVSDTELNDALEDGELDKGLLDVDKVEHDEGRRSPGPVDETDRRPPPDEDVTAGDQGTPIEPPD